MEAILHSLASDPIDSVLVQNVIKWKESGQPGSLSASQQYKWKDASVVKHSKYGKVLMLDGRIVLDYDRATEVIEAAWKDPDIGYQSAQKVWDKLSKIYLGVSRRHVADVVSRFEANQVIGIKHAHTPVKPIVSTKPWKYLQADLIDRQAYETTNHHNYLMSVVDV